jgi:competence protein ComEC
MGHSPRAARPHRYEQTDSLAALALVLLTQRPLAQGPGLRIFFVDIGKGAGTLIVGPPDATGKVTSLLVDGGPPGGGTTKIIPLLDSLGVAKIDYTVVTHYHIDHLSGITELLTAGRVGAVAYDNGDAAEVTPPNAGGTRNASLAYIAGAAAAGVPRQRIQPGPDAQPGTRRARHLHRRRRAVDQPRRRTNHE